MRSRVIPIIVAIAASLAGLTIGAMKAFGASTAPLSGTWNIQSSGRAASSGELLFRVTSHDGSDPIEVAVPVLSGANEDTVARTIRTTLGSQLRPDRFDVQMGQGANVLVSDAHREPSFSLELVDSDVENLRITVQSTTPIASPTVPQQSEPVAPPTPAVPARPESPGDAVPPAISPTTTPPPNTAPTQNTAPPTGSPSADAPTPQDAPKTPDGAAPPGPTNDAGVPASAPPMGTAALRPEPPGSR